MDYRFLVVGVKSENKYCILDLNDMKSEWHTFKEVEGYLRKGILIKGLTLVNGKLNHNHNILDELNFDIRMINKNPNCRNYNIYLNGKMFINSELAHFSNNRNDEVTLECYIKSRYICSDCRILLLVQICGCVKYDYEFYLSNYQLVEVNIEKIGFSHVRMYTANPTFFCSDEYYKEAEEETQGDLPERHLAMKFTSKQFQSGLFLGKRIPDKLPSYRCVDDVLDSYIKGVNNCQY